MLWLAAVAAVFCVIDMLIMDWSFSRYDSCSTSFVVTPSSEEQLIPRLLSVERYFKKCNICQTIEVKLSELPKSQLLSSLNYFLFTVLSGLTKSHSSNNTTIAYVIKSSGKYVQIFTMQCTKGISNESSNLERVLSAYSAAEVGFTLTLGETSEVELVKLTMQSIYQVNQLLLVLPYPAGNWADIALFLYFLLFACLFPIVVYCIVKIAINIWRVLRDKKTESELLSLKLPNNQSITLSSLHNANCPICWSEFSNLINNNSNDDNNNNSRVLGMLCNHGMCRDCLISLEKHKLDNHFNEYVTSYEVVGSVRCPYCNKTTNYNALRIVTADNNNSDDE